MQYKYILVKDGKFTLIGKILHIKANIKLFIETHILGVRYFTKNGKLERRYFSWGLKMIARSGGVVIWRRFGFPIKNK